MRASLQNLVRLSNIYPSSPLCCDHRNCPLNATCIPMHVIPSPASFQKSFLLENLWLSVCEQCNKWQRMWSETSWRAQQSMAWFTSPNPSLGMQRLLGLVWSLAVLPLPSVWSKAHSTSGRSHQCPLQSPPIPSLSLSSPQWQSALQGGQTLPSIMFFKRSRMSITRMKNEVCW